MTKELHPHSKASLPTKHLYSGHEYVNSAATDIRATFARIKAQQAAASHTKPLKRAR
jgi:hypothetical protein